MYAIRSYYDAQGDYRSVFWADLKPNPYLLSWLNSGIEHLGRKAIVVGCGVGDDAEALSAAGYEVTAFDISPEAIRLCTNRRITSYNVCYTKLLRVCGAGNFGAGPIFWRRLAR